MPTALAAGLVLVAHPGCPGSSAAHAVVAAPPLTGDAEVNGDTVLLVPADDFGVLFQAAYNIRIKEHNHEFTSQHRNN